MANPNESEYERQFREDLEKATALSMETLALDQFRRNKLYSSDSISDAHYGSTCTCLDILSIFSSQFNLKTFSAKSQRRPDSYNSSQNKYLQNSASTGSLAGPPVVPPRRHSESRELQYQHKHKDEPDLINFGGSSEEPVEPNKPPANDPHSNFIKFVDNMHK